MLLAALSEGAIAPGCAQHGPPRRCNLVQVSGPLPGTGEAQLGVGSHSAGRATMGPKDVSQSLIQLCLLSSGRSRHG